MINYVLGRAGSGKTRFVLDKYRGKSKAVFFAALRPDDRSNDFAAEVISDKADLIDQKCVIDVADAAKDVFSILEKALQKGIDSFFLDEFQLYSSVELVDLILNSDADFWIVHQFPKQLDDDDLFSKLWDRAEKKFLFDPYQPSEFYRV